MWVSRCVELFQLVARKRAPTIGPNTKPSFGRKNALSAIRLRYTTCNSLEIKARGANLLNRAGQKGIKQKLLSDSRRARGRGEFCDVTDYCSCLHGQPTAMSARLLSSTEALYRGDYFENRRRVRLRLRHGLILRFYYRLRQDTSHDISFLPNEMAFGGMRFRPDNYPRQWSRKWVRRKK